MKKNTFHLIIILVFSAAWWACNIEPTPLNEAPTAYSTGSEKLSSGLTTVPMKIWQVDVIWQGMKVIGGGPFPAIDTIYFYLEDANVVVYSKNKPTLADIKKQAHPPVAGYTLLGMQDPPRYVGEVEETDDNTK